MSAEPALIENPERIRGAETVLEENRQDPGYEWELVRRAQKGERAAFEEIYKKNVGRVYAICLRISADGGKAEELTQDVFVLAWQKLPSFRGESAFFSWLHRLTVNTVLMELRSEKRRMARVFTTEDLTAYETSARTAAPGFGIALEKAIARLPRQARTIFVLHDVEGYSHEEIAKLLGLATGSCKAQLHRARKLLREVLK